MIGAAVLVGKIAIREESDEEKAEDGEPKAGSRGGKTRARKPTPDERSKIAEKAANRRWDQKDRPEQENAK